MHLTDLVNPSLHNHVYSLYFGQHSSVRGVGMRIKESAVQYKHKKKVYTYQDYLNLPDEDYRYQLIGGELVMTPAPKVIHQEVSHNILLILSEYVKAHNLGKVYFAPCDVYLNELNVVQPDIFFIRNENKKIITEDNIKGAPDLIVEILSPNSAYYDLVEKKELYEDSGVKEYWIADPKKKRIEIYALDNQKYVLHQRAENNEIVKSKLLKEFSFQLAAVFSESE